MQKIPTLFERDPENRKKVLVGQVTPGCEWVLAGEGSATRKWDGTCVMLGDSGDWYARREVKSGKKTPDNYQLVNFDPVTGKAMGWEPIEQSPFAEFHAEAVKRQANDPKDYATGLYPGTYELVGPKVNGNPEKCAYHALIRHGWHVMVGTVDWLMQLCTDEGWEGIVWHHEDGRAAKLKVKDLPAVVPVGSA